MGKKWKQLVLLLMPIVIFYLLEAFEHNAFAEVRGLAQFFNILLLEFLVWILYFLIGNGKIALRIVLGVVYLFGLTNHYIMEFRSTPFVPWDFFSVKTGMSVAAKYDFTPGARVIWVSIGFILLFVVAHFLDPKCQWKFKIRLLPAGGLLIMLLGFASLLQTPSFQTECYLYPFLFTPAYMTKVNGMAVTFTMDLAYISIDKPSGYKESKAKELLESYEKEEKVDSTDLPNVIVIMDEAFSDISVNGDFKTNFEVMPFLKEIQEGKENTVSGMLNVSVCGGNTANSEFEFLTGNTMRFLPGGSIPYQQYVKEDTNSLARELSNLGYETYAQHPYYATGWNRDEVYPRLGFEHLSFRDAYYGKSLLRNYVSDQGDFELIKETYENKTKGKPMFLFNVTMQNHGGYYDEYENFVPAVFAKDKDSAVLDRYLSLVHETDAAVNDLITYFEEVDERTVIVFFGDHQPSDAVVSYVQTKDEESLRYQVPYFIWANYDIEEATNVETSLNYLSSHMCKLAGIPTSSYQNFLLELEEYYPVISTMKLEEAKEDDKDLLNAYQKLQYYQLFDHGGIK